LARRLVASFGSEPVTAGPSVDSKRAGCVLGHVIGSSRSPRLLQTSKATPGAALKATDSGPPQKGSNDCSAAALPGNQGLRTALSVGLAPAVDRPDPFFCFFFDENPSTLTRTLSPSSHAIRARDLVLRQSGARDEANRRASEEARRPRPLHIRS